MEFELEQLIERERQSVKEMQEHLSSSHRLLAKMNQSIEEMSNQYDTVCEEMQPFMKAMQSSILGEGRLSVCDDIICKLLQWHELAERLAPLLNGAVNEERLVDYCDGFINVKRALKELDGLQLKNCRIVKDSLTTLEDAGIDGLGNVFVNILQACSEPIDLLVLSQTGIRPEGPSEGDIQKLTAIAAIMKDSEKPFRLYVDVRGKYLALSIQPLLSMAKANLPGYQRKTHPIIIALDGVKKILGPVEDQLSNSIIPENPILLEQTFKPAITLLQGTLNLLAREGLNQCANGQRFLDCVYLFDLLEAIYETGTLFPKLQSALKGCFNILLDACKQYLDFLRTTISKHAFPIPENASIYEANGLAMTSIKALLQYETVVEAVLNSMEDTRTISSLSSTGSTSFLNPDSVICISFFVKECLEACESSFTKASKLFPRALKADIFLLNNYHYMLTCCRQEPVSLFVPAGIEAHLEERVEECFKILGEAWTRLGQILKSEPAKDAYKQFCGDLMEQLNVGGQIAVPDGDLRSRLRGQMERSILPVLQAFYHQNQSLFVAPRTGGARLDPDTVAAMLKQLFEG